MVWEPYALAIVFGLVVSAGIYLEALKLWWKHAPFRHHPAKVGPTRATASAVHPETTGAR